MGKEESHNKKTEKKVSPKKVTNGSNIKVMTRAEAKKK